jgi:hypothetical protein
MDATATASQAVSSGEICLKNARCDDLFIKSGADVTTNVKGSSLSADIDIQDFSATCSGDVTVDFGSITGSASAVAAISAPDIAVTGSLGSPISISKCSATIGVDSVGVNDVVVFNIAIPEQLTDSTTAMIFAMVQGTLEDQAGGGKLDPFVCPLVVSTY